MERLRRRPDRRDPDLHRLGRLLRARRHRRGDERRPVRASARSSSRSSPERSRRWSRRRSRPRSWSVIYIDLRVRHEAFDLQLLAGQLGVDPPEMGVSPSRRLSTTRRCAARILASVPAAAGRVAERRRPCLRRRLPPGWIRRRRPRRHPAPSRRLPPSPPSPRAPEPESEPHERSSHANEEARGLGCGGARVALDRRRARTRRDVRAGPVSSPSGQRQVTRPRSAQLRSIDEVDGRPLRVGAALAGASGSDLTERLRALAGSRAARVAGVTATLGATPRTFSRAGASRRTTGSAPFPGRR